MARKKSAKPEPVNSPVITPTDRLVLTLCLAIITHAVVVLGITFAEEQRLPPHYESMEIILVQQRSEAPAEAKALAQANLEGGGETSDEVTPAVPLPAPFPDQVAELTMPSAAEATPPDSPEAGQAVLAVNDANAKPDIALPSETTSESEPAEPAPEQPETSRERLPTAAALISNSLRIASLSAEIERKLEARSERPRRKFISASTREFRYAAYMEAWRAKVERVGNLNYPDEARRIALSGSLILDVALKSDGSIDEIIIRRSSGHRILDDAAIRIVNLAAPYAPFPDDIRAEADILHITRTWQFINEEGFR